MDAILCDRSPSFIVSLQLERGKSMVKAVGTNVAGNASGELGGLRRLGVAELVSNPGGADSNVEAGKQIKGSLLAGGVAESEAAEVDL
jgi:hypothetical protein